MKIYKKKIERFANELLRKLKSVGAYNDLALYVSLFFIRMKSGLVIFK